MKKYFLIFLCCFFGKVFAQNYNVKLINDSLLKAANAVTRIDDLTVIIKSASKAIVKHKYAITILNEEGANFAQYYNQYNKLISLENIDGHLFDATGKEIKSVKKKDIADFSANGDESLMTDTRYKAHRFYYTQYPYTVEYEDEQTYDGIFFLPSWNPIDTKCGIEQSSFKVETALDYQLNYKEIACKTKAIKTVVKDKNIYNWEIKNIVPIKYEPYQPSWDEINTAVYITPSLFEIENYKGDMNSWLSLGKFINTLNFDRQQLPDNIKQDIHKLTDNIKDAKEKVNILYDYLQKNSRYISVQIGIGGWQPYDAKYVASKKYGDCKALSNYMVSLLKEVNVPARYVLIKSGENKNGLWEDFTANFFDHAIVCVPLQKDSIWLECTSQTKSAGYMGSSTGNRKALLIDEDGGHVVSTPYYKAADNLQIRKVDAEISVEGDLKAKVFTHFTGL